MDVGAVWAAGAQGIAWVAWAVGAPRVGRGVARQARAGVAGEPLVAAGWTP